MARAGTTFSNPTGDVSTIVNGVSSLFMGIIDDSAGHGSASIQFGPTAGTFDSALFELDDLRFSTPAATPDPALALTAPSGTAFGNVLVGTASGPLGYLTGSAYSAAAPAPATPFCSFSG